MFRRHESVFDDPDVAAELVEIHDKLVSSSSWGLGRAAVCDCGTPWTFSYLFFVVVPADKASNNIVFV